jgi:hypothetical protein
MTYLAAACAVLISVIALVLLKRLWWAHIDGWLRLRKASAPDDLPRRLRRLVRLSIDAGLLADAGPRGLAALDVPSRETSDPYRTAGELINWLARESGGTGYTEVSGVIKAVYQLGHTLGARDRDVQRCLLPLLDRLKACQVGSSPIARVECVRSGAHLDTRTMASLRFGPRVSLPLGVIVYDDNGKVLGKAKVLCG